MGRKSNHVSCENASENGVKNGGKSSPSENPNFLKIPEIVGVTPSFSIVGLFLFGDFIIFYSHGVLLTKFTISV